MPRALPHLHHPLLVLARRAAARAIARTAIAAGLAAAALPACSTDLAHRWRDPELGFEVATDFDPLQVERMLRSEALPRIRALCGVFGVDSLEGLRISVHDQASIPMEGGFHVQGWHQTGEIHLMASWAGVELSIPTWESLRNLDHELVHALVERTELALPRWMEEGLCEVLSSAPLDAGGRLVPMPDGDRDRAARRLRAEGRWLSGPELLALRDAYPADPRDLAPMYAQGTSLTYALLSCSPVTSRADLQALAALSPAALAAACAAWERAFDTTPLAALLEPFVRSPDAAVRDAAARELGGPTADGAWWRAATALLCDPEPEVRTTMRVRALHRPPADEGTLARFRAWRDGSEPELRRAGLVALAQCGDAAAAAAFGRALADVAGPEWWQPLLWVAMIVPAEHGGRRDWPDSTRAGEAGYLAGFGAELADSIDRLWPRLAWDESRAAYALR